jgi:carbonic anhydrase
MTSALTRRRLVGSGVAVAVAGPVAALAGCGANDSSAASTTTQSGDKQKPPKSGDEALNRLLEGNARFVAGEHLHPGHDSVRRVAIAEEQEPFAAILGCADSRVPPEVVFDEGLGDLFDVRIAGNTVSSPLVVGSLEYSVEHLGSVLVLVLGHQGCGAVKAAVATATEGAHQEGDIQAFVDPIVPVVEQVKRRDPKISTAGLTDESIKANVEQSVHKLSHTPLLEHAVEDGKLKIVGAEYNLHTGKVEVL